MRTPFAAGAGLCSALVLSIGRVVAQSPAPLEQMDVPVGVDSGLVANATGQAGVVFDTVIRVPQATWLRLTFDEVTLGEAPHGAAGTVLRLTSLADGKVQTLDQEGLAAWHFTSAYFNGEAVAVELIAGPLAQESRVALTHVLAGPPAEGGIASQCGLTDDRLPSDDPRSARTLPGGCTAWLISDAAACFLTAGHCVQPGLDVAEFNVPDSTAGGAVQHPGPEDQYPVDPASIQFVAGGIGNDWCYFGCLPNTETGLTALDAQGDVYLLADAPPPVAGQTIRVTGYGADSTPPEWNYTQQTHTGTYESFADSTLQYRVDTEGGNSGSAVVNDDNGLAIGIHTHAGCLISGGANQGTAISNANLQSALAVPQGICLPAPPVGFSFPDGLPQLLNPGGDVVRVEVSALNDGTPQPGTGRLHLNAGNGYSALDMVVVSPNVYDAAFPAIPCGSIVDFYFSAESTEAELVENPLLAPFEHYSALVAGANEIETFDDDFETDLGWIPSQVGEPFDGAWVRAVPVPNSICDRGNPDTDADGSGKCWVTDNDAANCNSDVDNGSAILTSPIMDASVGDPVITYWRWFSNTYSTNPFEDSMYVEVSDDGGSSWVPLETVGPSGPEVLGGWYQKSFAVTDFVAPTDRFRIRFTAEDIGGASVVEAAVDGVRLTGLGCDAEPGDLNGDGLVGVSDLLILLGHWGSCPDPCPPTCPGDIDGDCTVGVLDLLVLLGNWTV